MQSLTNLLTLHKGKIYVFLSDKTTGNTFLQNAEAEGFTFTDGTKPTDRHWSSIIAVNADKTINYVGFVGHIAFQNAKFIGKQPLIRIDYRELLNQ